MRPFGTPHRHSPLRPRGRRGQGEVGDARALASAHLTLPRFGAGPSLSPLKGGEGNK
jgi:hypothetical protein